jgi:hypothetical protein
VDVLVEDALILELKCVERIMSIHEAQLLILFCVQSNTNDPRKPSHACH